MIHFLISKQVTIYLKNNKRVTIICQEESYTNFRGIRGLILRFSGRLSHRMGDRRPSCLSQVHAIITFKVMNMMVDPSLETQTFETQAQLLKVLTHPARLAILHILRDGEHCVCHMEAHLSLRQSYISQQLAVLREAGIIQDRRDGWNVFYRVADPKIYTVLDAVQQVIGGSSTPQISAAIDCPCPKCSP